MCGRAGVNRQPTTSRHKTHQWATLLLFGFDPASVVRIDKSRQAEKGKREKGKENSSVQSTSLALILFIIENRRQSVDGEEMTAVWAVRGKQTLSIDTQRVGRFGRLRPPLVTRTTDRLPGPAFYLLIYRTTVLLLITKSMLSASPLAAAGRERRIFCPLEFRTAFPHQRERKKERKKERKASLAVYLDAHRRSHILLDSLGH